MRHCSTNHSRICHGQDESSTTEITHYSKIIELMATEYKSWWYYSNSQLWTADHGRDGFVWVATLRTKHGFTNGEIQWKWTNVNLKFKLKIERQNQWPKNEFANIPIVNWFHLNLTRGPQAVTVTWVSETLHWLLVRWAHICISPGVRGGGVRTNPPPLKTYKHY